ncbi:hypothetical protein ACLOJK_032487 [Asimina triloba]
MEEAQLKMAVTLSREVVTYKATVLPELEAAPEVAKPSMEVAHLKVIPSESLEVGLARAKDVPVKGSLDQSPKKMAQARGRESWLRQKLKQRNHWQPVKLQERGGVKPLP